uniref:Uncharacterized protein n=1 Tax=viral metagenome TaxID=1070528 RepID=A0A6C0K0N0_9ZZZZ
MHKNYRSVDRDYIKKYGHPFEKPYRQEDVDAYVFPERDTLCGNGMMLYHRYKASGDKTFCWMSFCACNHYGRLCAKCRELNTSYFHGLEVPLCPEDMTDLHRILAEEEGWRVSQIYQWLHFWIQEHGKFLDHRVTKFVFWRYDKFSIFGMGGSIHKFFRYLYCFVKNGNYKYPYQKYKRCRKPSFVPDGPQSAEVNTADAALKLSMEVYSHGEEFQEMECVTRGKRKRTKYTKVLWGPMCSLYEESEDFTQEAV